MIMQNLQSPLIYMYFFNFRWVSLRWWLYNIEDMGPAWISNYIHYNVWDEITYPFINFNGATVEV